jgi:hypothetical protein
MGFPVLVDRKETEAARRLAGPRAPLSWSRPRLFRRWKWRIAAYGISLIGLLQVAAWWDGAVSRKPAELPAAVPQPLWIEISRPPKIFQLDAGEFAGEMRHRALRHRTGGGVQDIFEIGRAGEAAPAFRLIVYRRGGETVPQQSFFVELARRAAETGQAITRLTQPVAMATKFGDFEVAELGLARGGGAAKECLGFRFAAAAPDLRIDGFACDAAQSAPFLPPKTQLACLIDSLKLVTPTEDEQLIWFFAAHETTGASPCQGPAPIPRTGRAGGERTAALGLRGIGSK